MTRPAIPAALSEDQELRVLIQELSEQSPAHVRVYGAATVRFDFGASGADISLNSLGEPFTRALVSAAAEALAGRPVAVAPGLLPVGGVPVGEPGKTFFRSAYDATVGGVHGWGLTEPAARIRALLAYRKVFPAAPAATGGPR